VPLKLWEFRQKCLLFPNETLYHIISFYSFVNPPNCHFFAQTITKLSRFFNHSKDRGQFPNDPRKTSTKRHFCRQHQRIAKSSIFLRKLSPNSTARKKRSMVRKSIKNMTAARYYGKN